MKISFYDKKANTLTFPEVLTTEDLRSYFSNIALKKSDISEAHGIDDFTLVNSFVSDHKELAIKRTTLKKRLKVRNFILFFKYS